MHSSNDHDNSNPDDDRRDHRIHLVIDIEHIGHLDAYHLCRWRFPHVIEAINRSGHTAHPVRFEISGLTYIIGIDA